MVFVWLVGCFLIIEVAPTVHCRKKKPVHKEQVYIFLELSCAGEKQSGFSEFEPEFSSNFSDDTMKL